MKKTSKVVLRKRKNVKVLVRERLLVLELEKMEGEMLAQRVASQLCNKNDDQARRFLV